jgi:uncharacterized LabA/DUF88 family protein
MLILNPVALMVTGYTGECPMPKKDAIIYVDYDNIYESLRKYKVSPLSINFFPVVLDWLMTNHQLNPIDVFAYYNFDKFQTSHQNTLEKLGIKIRHASSYRKNYGDLKITVDAIVTLYEKPAIEAFVIISSDRDMIPLLEAISEKGKSAFLLSSKNDFQTHISSEAFSHEYLENILGLSPRMLVNSNERKLVVQITNQEITFDDIANAKQVSKLLYSSIEWKKYQRTGEPIFMDTYIELLSKRIDRGIPQIKKDFEVAHCLGFVTIYLDTGKKCFYLRKGEKYAEIMKK